MKKTFKGIRYGTMFFFLVVAVILTAIATYFYVSQKVDNLGRNQQIYTKLNKVNDLINKNPIIRVRIKRTLFLVFLDLEYFVLGLFKEPRHKVGRSAPQM